MCRAVEPRELVAQISGFRAIVAHRLHASIIAYSLGIPSVGLVWDKKVRAFGIMTGRERFFIDPTAVTPDHVFETLEEAMSIGLELENLKRLKLERGKMLPH